MKLLYKGRIETRVQYYQTRRQDWKYTTPRSADKAVISPMDNRHFKNIEESHQLSLIICDSSAFSMDINSQIISSLANPTLNQIWSRVPSSYCTLDHSRDLDTHG